MKLENKQFVKNVIYGIIIWLASIALWTLLLFAVTSCQKEEPTYCFECSNDVQHTTFCGYTLEEMNQVIEDWKGRQGDWKCQIKERSE